MFGSLLLFKFRARLLHNYHTLNKLRKLRQSVENVGSFHFTLFNNNDDHRFQDWLLSIQSVKDINMDKC